MVPKSTPTCARYNIATACRSELSQGLRFKSRQGETKRSARTETVIIIRADYLIRSYAASQTWLRILAARAALSCGKKRP
ncbi:hypothetical protein AGR4A_pAt10364 [Agrobacterium tumefaciens str. B6]|uniref:Uncharacterized protein n=1 Tax=Agrobacterium tumefaciens str. B6 TaxID=1183423 RepID=A0A822VBX8_AGRTU|nr:hypothetical protein AGR4A_pAt10364 [Agrobacterium tumefaciens str. B6]